MKTQALTLIVCCCIACATNTTDEQLIVDNRMAFNVSIANHDVSKMAEYCADDIMVVTSRNSRFLNRDQYASGLDHEFKSKEEVIYVRTPESIKVFPAWEMAAESGSWVGKWKNGTEHIDVAGSYYAKWKKVNNKWLITAEVFTPLQCNGGAYCAEEIMR